MTQENHTQSPLSEEHLSLVYEFDFTFADHPDMYVKCDVTVQEAMIAIKTGLLRNSAVSKIKLFAINDDVSVSFVYNVEEALKGNMPWSMIAN